MREHAPLMYFYVYPLRRGDRIEVKCKSAEHPERAAEFRKARIVEVVQSGLELILAEKYRAELEVCNFLTLRQS